MLQVQLIATERVGQLTGSTDTSAGRPWPLLIDAQGWPLLQDTGKWGAKGVDLGPSVEHSDGKLYFFFADAACEGTANPLNTDLVAWTDDTKVLRKGGHLAQGWTFFLPNDHQGATDRNGQKDWRLCAKCHSLFWAPNGDPAGSVCARDGLPHAPLGWNFVLPNDHQGATAQTGQTDWRFCDKCHGLVWAQAGNPSGSVCPKDGGTHHPVGWVFSLPNDHQHATDATGQGDWRFCGNCHGLFWNGDGIQGVCQGARGGGIVLHPVLNNRKEFDPFVADEPIRETLSDENEHGAFSYRGRIYVFTGFADQYWRARNEAPRPGDPMPGTYLVSKDRPDLPSNPDRHSVPPIPSNAYRKEFLFSPRIGWCPRDRTRGTLESHELLGLRFSLPHDLPETATRQSGWRRCGKCEALYRDTGSALSHCHRGGSHEPATSSPIYCLPHDTPEDSGNQGNWRRCSNCASLFWNGDPNGLCAFGGTHQIDAGAPNYCLPNDIAEDGTHQSRWRFCGKCNGLFWDGDSSFKGICPKDHAPHQSIGLTFVLQHDASGVPNSQSNWAFCGKCAALFWNGAGFKGVCPRNGAHTAPAGSFNFVLQHGVALPRGQNAWAYCRNCAALFYDGYDDKGSCPHGGGHQSAGSLDYVLPNNPGDDNDAGWRSCTKCHGIIKSGQEPLFGWAAPVVVQQADHPELPASPFPQSVVIFGFFFAGTPGIRLAWMPLQPDAGPILQDIRYYSGHSASLWSEKEADATILFPHANDYTHLSAAWLAGPRCWIVLYGTATDNAGDPGFRRPIMARLATSLTPSDNWTAEVPIFDPVKAGAYTQFMHEPGKDSINPDVPPQQQPGQDHPGWAYGALLLDRFTEWHAETRQLDLYYFMSTSSPYQVHLMHSALHVPVS